MCATLRQLILRAHFRPKPKQALQAKERMKTMSNIIASRKFAWVAGIVLVTLYFGPSILRFFATATHHGNLPQTMPAKPSPGIPAPTAAAPVAPGIVASVPATAPSAPPPPAASDPALAVFLGNWVGSLQIPKRGTCVLNLQVRDGHDKDHPLAGFSTLGCLPSIFDLMAKGPPKKQTPIGAVDAITKQLNTTEAILAGSVVGGTLEFKAEKNIGLADGNGCPMTSISLTPFAEQIGVEWKESQQEGCTGGQMLMKRE